MTETQETQKITDTETVTYTIRQRSQGSDMKLQTGRFDSYAEAAACITEHPEWWADDGEGWHPAEVIKIQRVTTVVTTTSVVTG